MERALSGNQLDIRASGAFQEDEKGDCRQLGANKRKSNLVMVRQERQLPVRVLPSPRVANQAILRSKAPAVLIADVRDGAAAARAVR